MPVFTVTAPNGHKLTVHAPEGATADQAITYAKAHELSQIYYEAHASGNAIGVKHALDGLQQLGAHLQPPTPQTQAKVHEIAQTLEAAERGAAPIPNTVSGSVEGAALGAVHDFNNPTFGAVQLGLEGASGLAHVLGSHALDSATADYNQWLKNREANYQAVTKGNVGSDVGGAVGTVAPFVMGTGAARAAGLLPEAGSAAAKAGSLLAGGGMFGLVQPELGQGSFAKGKAEQVGENALGALALAGIGAGTLKALGGIGNVAKLLSAAGRKTLAGQWLVKQLKAANLDPEAVAKQLEGARESVPGEGVTMIGGAPSVEVGQIHNFLKDEPHAQIQLKKQQLAANKTRMDAVRRLGGLNDKGEPVQRIGPDGKAADVLTLAKQARQAKWKQFEDTALDPANPASWVSPKDAIDAINSAETQFEGVKAVESALRDARARITEKLRPDGRIPARTLRAIIRSIDPNLQTAMQGARPKPDVVVGLARVRHAMGESLDRQVPGYADARAAYRADSAPINDMEAGRDLHAKAIRHRENTHGDTQVSLADVNAALRSDETAAHPISPAARATLGQLHESLRRAGAADENLGRAGSATHQSGELFRMFRNPWAMRLVGGMAAGAALGGAGGELSGRNPYEMGALGAMALAAGFNPAVDARLSDVLTEEGRLAASAPAAAAAIRGAQGGRGPVQALRRIAAKGLPFNLPKDGEPPTGNPPPGPPPGTPPTPPMTRADLTPQEQAIFDRGFQQPPQNSPRANNASGQTDVSLEAVSRNAAERAARRARAVIRPNGQVVPIFGPDAPDLDAQPGDVVVQRGIGADPNAWVPVSTGQGVTPALASLRIQQALTRLNALGQ